MKDNEMYVEKDGDINKGYWTLEECVMSKADILNTGHGEPLKYITINIKEDFISADMYSTDDKKTASGIGAAGLVGLAIAGPLGAVGGMLLGGKRKNETVVLCRLKNNRAFMAVMDIKLFAKLSACISKQKDNTDSVGGDTKECPMCAETVKAKAKICRYCNHKFV